MIITHFMENLSSSAVEHKTENLMVRSSNLLLGSLKFNKKHLWRFQLLNLQVLLKND